MCVIYPNMWYVDSPCSCLRSRPPYSKTKKTTCQKHAMAHVRLLRALRDAQDESGRDLLAMHRNEEIVSEYLSGIIILMRRGRARRHIRRVLPIHPEIFVHLAQISQIFAQALDEESSDDSSSDSDSSSDDDDSDDSRPTTPAGNPSRLASMTTPPPAPKKRRV